MKDGVEGTVQAPYYLSALFIVFRVAAFCVCILAGLLLLAEGLCRFKGLRPAAPAAQGALESGIVSSTYVSHRNAPNLKHPSQAKRSTNNMGLRGDTDYPKIKAPGKFRVGLFGSSVAYGTYVSHEGTIAVGTEKRLREIGVDAVVLNFGVPGYNLFNVDAYIKNYIWEMNLDAVVVLLDIQMLTIGGLDIEDFSSAVLRPFEKLSWLKATLKRAALWSAAIQWIDTRQESFARWIAEREKQELPRENTSLAKTSVVTPVTPQQIAEYEKRRRISAGSYMASIASFCHERGIRTYFVTADGPYYGMPDAEIKARYPGLLAVSFVSDPMNAYGLSASKAMKRDTEYMASITEEVAARYRAHAINLTPLLKARPIEYFVESDAMHYGELGGRKVGAYIAERIFAEQGPRQ